MASGLQILVDGDVARCFRAGEQVKGRVTLLAPQEEDIQSLKLTFSGVLLTKTTRPYSTSLDEAATSFRRREHEERVCLFDHEQSLAGRSTLHARKHTWEFSFVFPAQTEPHFTRFAHGPRYPKDPHPLPPSMKTYTDHPGGQAKISYHLQARLQHKGDGRVEKATQTLVYQPAPRLPELDSRIVSRTLHAQTWKPIKDTRKTIDKVFTKIARNGHSSTTMQNPRIVPTIHFPEAVGPGQKIPLMLSLTNNCSRAPGTKSEDVNCTLDSLKVSITTHTTSMCGQSLTHPEDTTAKTVKCISKSNINTPLSFSSPNRLTSNFRLVDDAECIPSFTTYTISRRYTLNLDIGIRCADQTFTIQASTALEILPRTPRSLDPHSGSVVIEPEYLDPLPLYTPREPSREFAPDYESLYSSSPSMSTLALVMSGSSFHSGSTAPSSVLSTPGEEMEGMRFERRMVVT